MYEARDCVAIALDSLDDRSGVEWFDFGGIGVGEEVTIVLAATVVNEAKISNDSTTVSSEGIDIVFIVS